MKQAFLLSSLVLFTTGVFAGSSSVQIPEGQLVDHPSVFPDVTPSAGPRVINGFDVFLMADYIMWQASEDNLQYASTGHSLDNTTVSQGSVKNPSFRYSTGFKAGIGFDFNHDMWDSSFNYTWLRSNKNRDSVYASSASGLIPAFSPAITLPSSSFFNSAHTLWQLHFNVLDWELGRNFYISKYLSLRPFIGLKGTQQTQNYANSYGGETPSDTFSYESNMKNTLWGVGTRGGINMSWHLSGTWSIFGDTAVTALWGQFNAKRKDSYQIDSANTVNPIYEKNHVKSITPVLELALGIRKDAWFCDNRLHVSIQAGWEEQVWWDQNRFSLSNSQVRGGNLTLQGLSARIRFDF
jgi:hypothetical protein